VVNFIEEAFDISVQDPATSCLPIRAAGTFGSQSMFDRNGSIVDRAARTESK
jgi:hypothetical protein